MIIIGADYHPSFQQIAFVDSETGEPPLDVPASPLPQVGVAFLREPSPQVRHLRLFSEVSNLTLHFSRAR